MSQPIGPFLTPDGTPVYFTPETIAAVELVQVGAVTRPVVWSTGSAAPVTLDNAERIPLFAACSAAGVVFAIFSQFSSGLDLAINVATALATWSLEPANQGATVVTGLRDQTGEAWLVLGSLTDTAATLAAAAPPPSSSTSRNPFDGYSSTVDNLAKVITVDADRTITGDELVRCLALAFIVPAAAPRTWTMPTVAQVDAAIAADSAGRPLSSAGSGAREFFISNASGYDLTLLDSVDLGSTGGSHVIPNNGQARIVWGQPTEAQVDSNPPAPATPGYFFTLSAENTAPTGPINGQGWAGGLILGDGTIVQSWGGLALANPYVPGSGVYEFSFNALPPGWGTVGVVTQFQNPPLQVVTSYLQNGNVGGTVYGDTIPTGAWGDYAFQFVVFPMVAPI
jgi:hypothetical protein